MSDVETRQSERDAAANGITQKHVAKMMRDQGSAFVLIVDSEGYDLWVDGLYAIPAQLPERAAWKSAEKRCADKVKEAHAARLSEGNEAYSRGLREARVLVTEKTKAAIALRAWAGKHGVPVGYEQP